MQCWGGNTAGLAAAPIETKHVLQPTTVAGLTAAAVAVSSTNACAIRPNGSVACWGSIGEVLGAVDLQFPQTTPLGVAGIGAGADQIAASHARACVHLASGNVQCWGRGSSGQNGDGLYTNTPTPFTVPAVSDAVQVATGTDHTCVLRANGTVQCWGSGVEGQMGDGASHDEAVFVPTMVPLPASAKAITANGNATCALLVDGTAYCWGLMWAGVGDGTTTSSFLSPTKLSGLTPGVIQVAIGQGHACALHASGAVQCWGRNLNGAVGNGTTTPTYVPVDVVGL